MNRESIFFKIAVSHALMLFVAMAVSGTVYYFLVSDFLAKSMQRDLGQASKVVLNLIDEDLSRAAMYSKLVSENFQIKKELREKDVDGVRSVLRSELEIVTGDFLSVADEKGVVFVHVGRGGDDGVERVPEPLHLSDVFQRCENSGRQAVGIETIFPNTIVVTALSPIREIDGSLQGFLRMGYLLDNKFAQRIKDMTGIEVALIYRGVLAASSSMGMRTGGIEVGSSPVGSISRENVVHTSHFREGEVELLVAYPRSRIAVVQRNGLFLICLITFFAFTLGIVLSLQTARRIVSPIKELMFGVRKVEDGDLNYQMLTVGKDEAGELARSFNRMTEALRIREAEIRESQRQLIESGKLAAVGELAAGVAHEIGNPLAALSGYIQLLKIGAERKDSDHYLEEMEREVFYIDGIIRELIDFSRPGEFQMEEVDVNEAVEESLRMVAFQKAMRDVQVHKELHTRQPVVIGNRKEILQALLNITLNAAQAMPDGGELSVRVEIGPSGKEVPKGTVGIIITDTGIGIREEDIRRIFDPFFTT
ncbi:MAG: HAMP domain-containing protein, partial [bacterium]